VEPGEDRAASATDTGRSTPAASTLVVHGRSRVRAGELRLLLDGRLVYTRLLSLEQAETDGDLARRGLFKRREEAFAARIPMPPGSHEIVAQVFADGKEYGREDRLIIDAVSGASVPIQVVAGRLIGSSVSLKSGAPRDGAPEGPPAPRDPALAAAASAGEGATARDGSGDELAAPAPPDLTDRGDTRDSPR
jgi:hypothetical protein